MRMVIIPNGVGVNGICYLSPSVTAISITGAPNMVNSESMRAGHVCVPWAKGISRIKVVQRGTVNTN